MCPNNDVENMAKCISVSASFCAWPTAVLILVWEMSCLPGRDTVCMGHSCCALCKFKAQGTGSKCFAQLLFYSAQQHLTPVPQTTQ